MVNLSALLLEYLNLKLRNIRLESDRQTFLLNTGLINQKLKDLIWITQKNTESFLLKLNTRYKDTLMNQSDNDPEKYKERVALLKENIEVVSYNIWRFLTKEWMQHELLRYFDTNIDRFKVLSFGYLNSENLSTEGDKIKDYINLKIKIGQDKRKKVRTLCPVDSDEFYPGVNTGIDL